MKLFYKEDICAEDIENGDVQGEEVDREYGFSGDDTAIEYRMFLRYVKKDS